MVNFKGGSRKSHFVIRSKLWFTKSSVLETGELACSLKGWERNFFPSLYPPLLHPTRGRVWLLVDALQVQAPSCLSDSLSQMSPQSCVIPISKRSSSSLKVFWECRLRDSLKEQNLVQDFYQRELKTSLLQVVPEAMQKWYQGLRKFQVISFQNAQSRDFLGLSSPRPRHHGAQFLWSAVRWLQFKTKPNVTLVKYTFQDQLPHISLPEEDKIQIPWGKELRNKSVAMGSGLRGDCLRPQSPGEGLPILIYKEHQDSYQGRRHWSITITGWYLYHYREMVDTCLVEEDLGIRSKAQLSPW